MKTEIKPALTAEEWAEFLAGGGSPYEWGGRPYQIAYRSGPDDSFTLDGSFTLPELAAKALHGRLTWEMVDALRRAAQDATRESAESPDSAALWALADLLESLLPPREGRPRCLTNRSPRIQT